MSQGQDTPIAMNPKPAPVQAHVTIAAGEMRWTCPVCGEEHRADVRGMAAAGNTPVDYYTCGTVRYIVYFAPALLGRVRRALGIPAPTYPAEPTRE
jgi:hypothetical protein